MKRFRNFIMRILQLLDVPWDSGLAHYALALSQGLARRGHRVFFSSVPGEKPWVKAQALGLDTVPYARLCHLASLRRFAVREKIELMNAHTGSTHSLAVGGALGQKIAVVRTRSDARPVRKRVGSIFLFKHTRKVIAAAEYIREHYVETVGLPRDQVVTIHQGIDPGPFGGKGVGPSSPIVGMVARLDPVKGHRYFLEAAALLHSIFPRARFWVMGQEENLRRYALEALAAKLGISKDVEFLGYEKNIAARMAECSVGVVASVGSEAVSRVALEWMAAGRPVVATQVGGLPEIVRTGRTGFLVPPKDSRALAQAIGVFLRDPQKVNVWGQEARRHVEALFSLDRFVKETERVYGEALCRN